MWPRVGGHVGPPTPLTPEVDRFERLMPRRSPPPLDPNRSWNALRNVPNPRIPAQSLSPQFIGPPRVLTRYTVLALSPRVPVSYHPMPLEPYSSPRRSYHRMYRRMQHPYRLLSLSERMHIYRPVLHSLPEEEPQEIANVEVQQTPTRTVKRQARFYPTLPPGVQIIENPPEVRRQYQSPGVPRFPSDNWTTHRRQSQWEQPDEPEIIITSDVQLQTDDNETGYNSNNLSAFTHNISSSVSTEATSNGLHSTSIQTQTDLVISVSENIPEIGAFVDVETQRFSPDDNDEDYYSQDESVQSDVMENYSSPNSKEFAIANQIAFNKCLKNLAAASMVPFKVQSGSMPALPTASYKARQVANSVIKHARNNKTIDQKALRCLNCKLFPILPVTGSCGHTRCTKCIERHGDCPCGTQAPKNLHVNTVIQYLLSKMLPKVLSDSEGTSLNRSDVPAPLLAVNTDLVTESVMVFARGKRVASTNRVTGKEITPRIPLAPQVQFEYARRLLVAGRFRDAAPHFARVAASSAPRARIARSILARLIMYLGGGSDDRRISRDLFRSVSMQAAEAWLRPGDLECVLCYHTYTHPVTTPCGHTYCRTCIERALDYRKACALCQRPLDDFNVNEVCETEFVTASLFAIDAAPALVPPEPDVIPIFVCTVAYPSIPCPLFIFDPRYWLMIRRVLESGSRKFGMVAYERDRNYSDYGTILEVCDCVHLEDGRSFLSTVGVSRFRVIGREVRDGCEVARIQQLTDITPSEEVVILEMRCLSSQILYKALLWLNSMNKNVRTEIESAFGEIPHFDDENGWWDTTDGPAWLWWLIAILPLRSEIKVLILSTKNLLKRMMAVSRTLDAIDQVAITTTATSECEIRSALTNAEEWLERGS